MSLAGMIAFDKSALLCDMAETYGIYDLRSLPVRTTATLAAGLREDSRIMMKMRGAKAPRTDILKAMIYDMIRGYMWAQGMYKGDEPPLSIADVLLGKELESDTELESFNSVEEYERRRLALEEKYGRN